MGFGIQGLSGSGLSNRLDHIKSTLQDLPNSALSTDVSQVATQLIETIQAGVASGGFTESGLDTIRTLFDELQLKLSQLGFGTEVTDNLAKGKSRQHLDDVAGAANMPLPPIAPQFQIFQVKPVEDVAISISVDGGAMAMVTLPPGMIHGAASGNSADLDRLQTKIQTAFATDYTAGSDDTPTQVSVTLSADMIASASMGNAATIQKIAQVIDIQLANTDPKRDGNRGAFVATLIQPKDTAPSISATAASASGLGGVVSSNRTRIISKIEALLAPYNDRTNTIAPDKTGLSEDEQRTLALISSSLVDGINSMEELQMIAAWLSQAPGLTVSVPTLLDTIQWAIQDFVATQALSATPDQLKTIVNQINTEMGAAVPTFNAISDDELADVIEQAKVSLGVPASNPGRLNSTVAAPELESDQPIDQPSPPAPMGVVPPPPRLSKDWATVSIDPSQATLPTTSVSAASDSQGDTDADRNAAHRQAARFQRQGDKLIQDVTRYLQSVCEVAADVQLNKMSADLNQFGLRSMGISIE